MASVSWEIQMCAGPSHGMFPLGFHRYDIPMDKPGYSTYQARGETDD